MTGTEYKVAVKTSDIKNANTSANVFICLYGENGNSGEIKLQIPDNKKPPFRQDQLDIFTLPNLLDLGVLSICRVWHDNKGGTPSAAAWHLGGIEVQEARTKRIWVFECGKWLSSVHEDQQISRDLKCRPAADEVKDGEEYDIMVFCY